MTDWSLASFENPVRHAAIADIVRRRSTNPADVREVALADLDLLAARAVLDLGCGFGFMSEVVAGRIAPDARITGVDACPANEQSFLQRLAGAGRSGEFVCQRIEERLPWPDNSFDLVVASYSLYFFPGVIPEVARVLAPQGVFVALTHVERACRELLSALEAWGSDTRSAPVSRHFPAEEGDRLLASWFGDVHRVDHANSLVFQAEHKEELLAYLQFKLPYLSHDSRANGELPAPVRDAALAALAHHGRLVFSKDDAAFRCRRPQHQ